MLVRTNQEWNYRINILIPGMKSQNTAENDNSFSKSTECRWVLHVLS